MRLYFAFLSFILGTVFGSFCNAWAWRIVNGESIAKGRSHCTACGHELSAVDLVPLLSWIFLKGKCRYCGAKIPVRYPLAELISGLAYGSIFWVYGFSWDCLRFFIAASLLLTMSLEDLDSMEIEDYLIIALALAAALPSGYGRLWGGLLALPLLALVLLFEKLKGMEMMGGADIKLVAALGLHLGAGQTLLLIIIACFAGIGFALLSGKGKSGHFPFGPALAFAVWPVILWGGRIITWYLGLF